LIIIVSVSSEIFVVNDAVPKLELIPTEENLKVAFIADQALGIKPGQVLDLMRNEGAELVIHSGDFDYKDNPIAWDNQINDHLGVNFPYLSSIGNHDFDKWFGDNGYQQKIIDRIDRIDDLNCTGTIGSKSSCTYKGLFVILSGIRLIETGHARYIQNELESDHHLWSICSWHYNQNKMQLGQKGNGTGWDVYEKCKEGGGIIATGHEHSYSRTLTLSEMEQTKVHPVWNEPDNVVVTEGATFAFVSGLGGHSIRNQDRCTEQNFTPDCNIWASIQTSDQGQKFGALFCIFYVDGNPNNANCYFKDINGKISDSFSVKRI